MSSRNRTPRYAIGHLVNAYITRSGRSVEQVADAAGVSRTSLYNWIGGTRFPADGLALLRAELGIPQSKIDEEVIVERAERLRDASAEQPNPDEARDGLEEGLEARGRRAKGTPKRGPRGTERS